MKASREVVLWLERARQYGYADGLEDARLGVVTDLSLGAQVLPKDWHNAYVEGYNQGHEAGVLSLLDRLSVSL